MLKCTQTMSKCTQTMLKWTETMLKWTQTMLKWTRYYWVGDCRGFTTEDVRLAGRKNADSSSRDGLVLED